MMAYLSLVLAALVLGSQAQYKPNCASGREGQVLVHLFSWKWDDIANECERFLGPKGFCGVQVSPPNEHRVVTSPNRPWWEAYQPISYKLDSRFGNRAQFTSMVQRCNAAGVRIYIDAVINHMAGIGSGTGSGTGGSYYNTREMKFSEVPYGPNDFGKSCTSNIQDYNNIEQVRNCRLLGLLDLAGGSDYVRGKIAGYLNDMLQIGIDGFRIDAAKHMWPADIQETLKKTASSKYGRPFVFQEVIDLGGNEPIKGSDYQHLGKVTEFVYGLKMNEIFRQKKTKLTHLKTFGSSWGLLDSSKALAFVDNHDNQRGHGGGGNVITHKSSKEYKLATIFMLSWPYGTPKIMSSYAFSEDWTGPPSEQPGNGATCSNGWICEHRWRQIMNMVAWRNSAGESAVSNWWSNGNNQISFSRGGKAFIVFNQGDGNMNTRLQTGLPQGQYCDVISGGISQGSCSGMTIDVGGDGTAAISLNGNQDNPVIAIHAGSKLGSSSGTTSASQTTTGGVIPVTPPARIQRTVVFIKKTTTVGQNVFLRGGCGSSCKIPIRYDEKLGSSFDAYNAWAKDDKYLDWQGAESSQGSYLSKKADGSPMVWTSNSFSSGSNYVSINKYGDHYWMWDAYIDCSSIANGWFEVKGYLADQWESAISQTTCSGNGVSSGTPQFGSASNNHVARCGAVNVFEWSKSSCQIDRF